MSPEFARIAQAALENAEVIIPEIFPQAKLRGREWEIGGVNGEPGRSMQINSTTGKWVDHANPEHKGGDLISLYAARFSTSQGNAAKELSNRFGLTFDAKKPTPRKTGAFSPAEAARRRRQAQMDNWLSTVPSVDEIVSQFPITADELCTASPFPLADGTHPEEDDTRVFLKAMFPRDATLFCGRLGQSDQQDARYSARYRTVEEWLSLPEITGPRISPSILKEGSHSYGAGSVLSSPYMILESDSETMDRQASVLKWAAVNLGPLLAVVWTGSRSLHGWFNRPSGVAEDYLRGMVEKIGCDPEFARPTQLARLPGVVREDEFKESPKPVRRQQLIYLRSKSEWEVE